jgi:hypothetical protein
MRRLLPIFLSGAAVVTGCGETPPEGVEPVAVEEITEAVDCDYLQSIWNLAERSAMLNNEAGYIELADVHEYYMRLTEERMGNVGCPSPEGRP